MKLTNKYMMFATAALLLASCDLDKFPTPRTARSIIDSK